MAEKATGASTKSLAKKYKVECMKIWSCCRDGTLNSLWNTVTSAPNGQESILISFFLPMLQYFMV